MLFVNLYLENDVINVVEITLFDIVEKKKTLFDIYISQKQICTVYIYALILKLPHYNLY